MGVRRAIAISVAAALLPMAFATAAQASSLVYVKGGNVWLANGDGSGPYQVTLDGTAANPYYSPSEADDGTIVAVRGSGPSRLYRMTQNGTQLNPPFATASPLGNVAEARVSPDGRLVAYSFVTATNGCSPSGGNCTSADKAVMYTYADHLGDPGAGMQTQFRDVSWMGSHRTALTGSGNAAFFDDVGGGDSSDASWFDECDYYDCSDDVGADLHDAIVSRQGNRLAEIRDFADPSNPYELVYIPHLAVFPLAGNATTDASPAKPDNGCQVDGVAGQAWSRPAWSPDGNQVAWTEDDGIHVLDVPGFADCSSVAGDRLLLPGASDVAWGPAAVAPAPRGGGAGGDGGGSGGGTGGGGDNGGQTGTKRPNPAHVSRLAPQRLARLRAHGVRVRVHCSRACRLAARLTASRGTARRLHLGHHRTVSRASKRLRHAGSTRLTLRPNRTARKRLRHPKVRAFRLTLTLKVTDGSGHHWAIRRTVKVHR